MWRYSDCIQCIENCLNIELCFAWQDLIAHCDRRGLSFIRFEWGTCCDEDFNAMQTDDLDVAAISCSLYHDTPESYMRVLQTPWKTRHHNSKTSIPNTSSLLALTVPTTGTHLIWNHITLATNNSTMNTYLKIPQVLRSLRWISCSEPLSEILMIVSEKLVRSRLEPERMWSIFGLRWGRNHKTIRHVGYLNVNQEGLRRR